MRWVTSSASTSSGSFASNLHGAKAGQTAVLPKRGDSPKEMHGQPTGRSLRSVL
jgi:hypothetical protein